jgi:hypothetical protein
LPRSAKPQSARKKLTKAGNRPRGLNSQSIGSDLDFEALLKLFEIKTSTRLYREQLRDPIVRASKLELMLGGSPEDQERLGREEDSRNVVAQFGKLFLLLDHFQIPRASYLRWFHLAFHLARQHVPGMKIVSGPNPRRGPKGKWKETQLDSELIVAVTAVKLARRRGVADAIRILRKREPNVWGRFDEGSLRTRYYEALRPMKPYRRGSLIESLEALLLPEGPSE